MLNKTETERELADLLSMVLRALYMDVGGHWQVNEDAESNVDYVQERLHEISDPRDDYLR